MANGLQQTKIMNTQRESTCYNWNFFQSKKKSPGTLNFSKTKLGYPGQGHCSLHSLGH